MVLDGETGRVIEENARDDIEVYGAFGARPAYTRAEDVLEKWSQRRMELFGERRGKEPPVSWGGVAACILVCGAVSAIACRG